MKLDVFWLQDSVDQLLELSQRQPRQAARVVMAVRSFGRDGRGDFKKLSGANEWRLRSGGGLAHLLQSRRVQVVCDPDRQPPGRVLTTFRTV